MQEPTTPVEPGDEMAAALDSEVQAPTPAEAARAMKLAQQVLAGGKKRGRHWKRRIIERRQGKATKAQRRRHSKAMERKATRRFEVVTGRRAFRSTPTQTATEVVAKVQES